ncbi:MAG: type II CAAX endopeptidase family protein [Brachybacterium sp.]|nr:type II CAAX endopeptidase family protein [Brachybacterium sp.]
MSDVQTAQTAPTAEDRALGPRHRVVEDRPFGAHMRTRWWAPLAVLPILGILMLGLQLIVLVVVGVLEWWLWDRDPLAMEISPLLMLGLNLSLIAMAPLSLLALRWIAGVPWRAAFSVGRAFSWRRLGLDCVMLGSVILVVFAVYTAVDGMPPVTIGATAIALAAMALLLTPLQAAAEEVMFRGVIGPLVGSWLSQPGLALAVGITVSSLFFGVSHGATDPWLAVYYVVFGLCAALMAVISRGLEAPIAFHVMNNVILMLFASVTTGDQGLDLDRTSGAGGPFILVFIALDIVLVGVVWALERRRRASGGK